MTDIVKTKINIKMNTSDNPWIATYQTFLFDRSKIEPAAKDLVVECTGRDYKSSHDYGKHVSYVMEKYWDNTCGSILPFYKAVLVVLKELKKPDEGWHGGATAAIRCLETRIAYSTPSFVEAKRYNELYGS